MASRSLGESADTHANEDAGVRVAAEVRMNIADDVKFKTRFGREVKFKRREKVFRQLRGELFLDALTRTYYPGVYKRNHKEAQK